MVIVQEFTTKNPIQMIGLEAGVCWGADITNSLKNYLRGIDCLKSGHLRTAEYPQVYLILEGYSARVIREFYTHIGGSPTRLQASTRYIDYGEFNYVIPPSVTKNSVACAIYTKMMEDISTSLKSLEALGVPREDCGMGLPLAMKTKVVVRTNLRNLIDMCHVRMCTRAYWEMRELINDIIKALSEYSVEWDTLTHNFFKPKCEVNGFCTEKNSCGRRPKVDIEIKESSIPHGKIIGDSKSSSS